MRFTRNNFVRLIIGLFVIFNISLSFAGQGCCSHHGGVSGCNRSNNRELCKDGSTSPTCPCTGSSSSWYNSKPTSTSKQTKPSRTTTTSTTTEATTATTAKTTQKGCCSRHGGVAGCKNGYALCKDKSVSTSCKC